MNYQIDNEKIIAILAEQQELLRQKLIELINAKAPSHLLMIQLEGMQSFDRVMNGLADENVNRHSEMARVTTSLVPGIRISGPVISSAEPLACAEGPRDRIDILSERTDERFQEVWMLLHDLTADKRPAREE